MIIYLFFFGDGDGEAIREDGRGGGDGGAGGSRGDDDGGCDSGGSRGDYHEDDGVAHLDIYKNQENTWVG